MLIQNRKVMKKNTIILIAFAIVLSSCATRRTTPQRADNLPPVYVSLKNILADNVELDRNLRHPIVIDGIIVLSLWENPDKKIDINSIVSVDIITSIAERISGYRRAEVLLIATNNVPPRARTESDLPKVQISLKNLLADNGLCENCLVVVDGQPIDELDTMININAIDGVWAVRGTLFLVDGQPMSTYEAREIDVDEIVSMSVLKDVDRARAFDRRDCFLIITTGQ